MQPRTGTRFGLSGALLSICWVLLSGAVALGGEPPVPPNDECVDALAVDSGTCIASGAVCSSSDDCTTMTCSYDGTDCTAGPELCVNDDLCENKVCVDGPTPGADCLEDGDCGGGTCDGTCGLSGVPCFGPPGEEPQCVGPDLCEPDLCRLHVSGTTVGALSTGEWFGNVGAILGAGVERLEVPGVWLKFTGTGTVWDFSGCNPGTLAPFYWNFGAYCRDCDRLADASWGVGGVEGDNLATTTCDTVRDYSVSFCTADDQEWRWYVSGHRSFCSQRSCALSGEDCAVDEDCPANTCDGSTCLSGEACTVDADCPADFCDTGDCIVNHTSVSTGYPCLTHADCPDSSQGEFEFTFVDTGVPCTPPGGPTDCLVGNQVLVVDGVLTDDGDDDGWADTNETVEMRVRLRNYGDEELTGLVARLTTDDPKIDAILEPMVAVGTLAAKETRVTEQAFRFRVGDVERAGVDEDFSVRFEVELSSDRWNKAHRPQAITLDLDLDASGGAGSTAYREGFESGSFGTLVPMNLDLGRDSLEASDGYRCRENDPDNPASGAPGYPSCFLGGTPEHAEAFYWQVEGPGAPDGGRAFGGSHALRMGVWLNGQATTPLRVLEAVRSGEPINLGSGRVCSEHRTRTCAEDDDCPAGEACLDVGPELSFKQQVALWGGANSCFGPNPGTSSRKPCRVTADCPVGEACRVLGFAAQADLSTDRGVVQVQRAAADGSPVGNWITLSPFEHPYDSRSQAVFGPNCTFDPTDDGTTEDDAFDAESGPPGFSPDRFGPSSTCAGTHAFNYQGETDLPFDPAHVGRSSDGPGLEGDKGLGTWVDPRFSLRRFRGQRVRLRFLYSGWQVGDLAFYPPDFRGIRTDGWWIDDVEVTDALTSPATLQVDSKICAPGADQDADGTFDCRDCAPRDDQSWSLPGEARQLLLDHTGGVGGTTSMSWSAPNASGATSVSYVTLARGPGYCEETNQGGATSALDEMTPASGELLEFLVRAENACGAGPVGRDSLGNLRDGCP